jgi:AhpD family alkylhydroperoxidase
MSTRVSLTKINPNAHAAVLAMQKYVDESGLEPLLPELIKLRASQSNGCAYCLDLHTKDARAMGETEQRLYTVSAWRETPFFTERERAALALTEAVTLASIDHVPDSV